MNDNNKALEKVEESSPAYLASASEEWGATRARVLRDTIAGQLDAPEFSLFVEVCRAKKLDPFSRQIHAVKRWDSMAGREVMTIQTGIDGFRTLAERTGKYVGQRGPFWCGDDGVWRDVWLEATPPKAAKVEVLRKDFDEPLVGVALFQEYAQQKKGGQLNHMWGKFSTVMLAKCAEAVALRRAFPEQLSGLYTNDEMHQAEDQYRRTTARDDAMKATAPIERDANGESTKTYQEIPRGNAKAAGASATKTLLLYVAALDSCENVDDISETIESWAGKLPAKAAAYIEAYEEHRRSAFDGTSLDADKERLVEAINAMRVTAREQSNGVDVAALDTAQGKTRVPGEDDDKR